VLAQVRLTLMVVVVVVRTAATAQYLAGGSDCDANLRE
jgi:hypothetical protein